MHDTPLHFCVNNHVKPTVTPGQNSYKSLPVGGLLAHVLRLSENIKYNLLEHAFFATDRYECLSNITFLCFVITTDY